jgi:hypothetical protein
MYLLQAAGDFEFEMWTNRLPIAATDWFLVSDRFKKKESGEYFSSELMPLPSQYQGHNFHP